MLHRPVVGSTSTHVMCTSGSHAGKPSSEAVSDGSSVPQNMGWLTRRGGPAPGLRGPSQPSAWGLVMFIRPGTGASWHGSARGGGCVSGRGGGGLVRGGGWSGAIWCITAGRHCMWCADVCSLVFLGDNKHRGVCVGGGGQLGDCCARPGACVHASRKLWRTSPKRSSCTP